MHRKIKITRQLKNLKQYELAKLLGVTPNYVSLIEKGKKTPSLKILKKISNILDIKLSSLLDDDSEESKLTRDLNELVQKYDLDMLLKNIKLLKNNKNINSNL